jgi:MFS family permease
MSWRWCFWVNVPIDGLALILTAVFLKVHTPYTPFWEGIKAIDWLGSLAVVGGTVSLLLGLEFGGVTFAWDSAPVITLIVSGVAIWIIFFLVETHVPKYPLIPVRIFKTISNLSILAVDFSHGFVFIAGSYYLPVYFQAVLGANALQSGVYLFPFVLTLSATAIGTGYIINKTGSYLPLITGGMMFLTLGFALFTDLPAKPSWPRIVIYQIIAGIGVGPNFQSPMLALQNSVAPHDIAPATATFGFVRQLANAISVVLGGVLLQSQLYSHRAEMLDAGIEVRVVDLLTGGSAISSVMEIDRLPKYPREVARQAFASSMSKMWLMYVCMAIIGLGLTDFIRKKELSTVHTETITGLEEQERIRLHEEDNRAARKAGRAIGVLPDLEEQQSPKEDFGYGGKSAEVLGYSSSRPASLKSQGLSRAPSSSRLNGNSHSSRWNRPTDAGRDKYIQTNIPGELPLAPIARKEGAITAARRRSSLRQLSKKIADGRHAVQPLRTDSSTLREEDQHELRDGTSSYYPEESGWYDDISDVDPLELEKVNARIDDELRASQSWASRTDGQSPIAAWTKDVPNPYRNGRGGG